MPPPFTVNPHRKDPYKVTRFRVSWDGRAIPGVGTVSALRRSTEVVTYREGADPSRLRRSPGLTTHAPILLERGVTHDTSFEEWADLVARADAHVALRSFRKDVRIELLNEAGQVVLAYVVRRAWPAEYAALAALDAEDDRVARESLTLAHEGWERDTAVTEPLEPAG